MHSPLLCHTWALHMHQHSEPTSWIRGWHRITLQHTAAHCNTLQHTDILALTLSFISPTYCKKNNKNTKKTRAYPTLESVQHRLFSERKYRNIYWLFLQVEVCLYQTCWQGSAPLECHFFSLKSQSWSRHPSLFWHFPLKRRPKCSSKSDKLACQPSHQPNSGFMGLHRVQDHHPFKIAIVQSFDCVIIVTTGARPSPFQKSR